MACSFNVLEVDSAVVEKDPWNLESKVMSVRGITLPLGHD
jgi:hypothetical protein